jgi:uroporphyrinogen-III synthase
VQVAGLEVWASPETERLVDVVALLDARVGAGDRVAFQHYGARDGEAIDAIAALGASVVEVPVYRYGQAADGVRVLGLIDAVCDGSLDAVTFTSAPAVRNLMAVAEEHGRADDLMTACNERGVVVACIGPVCIEVARASGFAQPIAPSRGRLGLMVRVLSDALGERRWELRCDDVSLVVQGRVVAVNGDRVALPRREADVLAVLLERRGAVVSKAGILRELGDEPGGEHALETTIARLRRRLGPAAPAIRVVRSRGYRLEATA